MIVLDALSVFAVLALLYFCLPKCEEGSGSKRGSGGSHGGAVGAATIIIATV